jgi:hypothetical protein
MLMMIYFFCNIYVGSFITLIGYQSLRSEINCVFLNMEYISLNTMYNALLIKNYDHKSDIEYNTAIKPLEPICSQNKTPGPHKTDL